MYQAAAISGAGAPAAAPGLRNELRFVGPVPSTAWLVDAG